VTQSVDGTSPGRFGNFNLLQAIARGGMSQVWAAEDHKGNPCVVKLLRSMWLEDPAARRRFLDEAELLARFDHPSIVKVIERGDWFGRLFVALEPIRGVPLRVAMNAVAKRGRVLPPGASSRVICDVLSALHYAHTCKDDKTGAPLNVVHRDVSPQNIMVCFDGQVKLLDFGTAKCALFEDFDAHGAVHGTLPYMAPEQVSGDDVSPKSDVYAAAVIVYELFLGRPFFGGLLAEQAVDLLARGYEPPGLDVLDPKLAAALKKALAVRPDRRFESAAAFAQALSQAIPPYSAQELAALMQALIK
jgi:eukaryotic-like serine/threonine-protein kinase